MRHRLRFSMLAIAASLPFAACAFAGDVPHDPEAFTGYAEAELQPQICTVPVTATGPLTLKVGPISDNLGQLYDLCQAKPDGCEAALQQHAQDLRQTLGLHR